MSDVPKIVRDRLRAGTPGGVHPDTDMLTAFAEQALSPTEREDVVRHLARCGDCREIVALSIPPVEAVAQPDTASEGISARRSGDVSRAWFAWPNLRWAAMAAAVVVVASVLWLRPGKPSQSMVETVNERAESAPLVADSSAKPVAPVANQVAPTIAAKTVKPDSSAPRARPELRLNESAASYGQTQTSLAEKAASADNDKRLDSLQADNRAMKVPPATTGAVTGVVAREQGEVTAAQGLVNTETAEVSQAVPTQEKSLARTQAPSPIEKAKPAAKEEVGKKAQLTDEVQGKLAATYSASDKAFATRKLLAKDAAPQWSLAQGRLQRSLDAGATWQIVLQVQHPLLTFNVRGDDVWAGGQAGTLLHSADSGTTWTVVQPAAKSESLNSDIVGIEIRSLSEIVLSISKNESWTTLDAGKTWEKK